MRRSMTRNVVSAALGMYALFALTLPAYSQTTVVIHMKDLRFSPDRQSVNAGDTVTFVNDDEYAHTVTAADKSFDSGNIAGHASWTHTFSQPGTYAYVCTYHLPNMRGELVVKPLATGEPTPSATPSQTATPSSSPPAQHAMRITAVVHIRRLRITPQILALHVGDVVNFANEDSVPRTVTAINKSFDSGSIKARGSWKYAFVASGVYRYISAYHGNVLRGTIYIANRKALL